MEMTFGEFFTTATRHEAYDYQRRLGCGYRLEGEPEPRWLSRGTECASRLINIPTGLGKTAAVVLAWLWNRVAVPPLNSQPSTVKSAQWPRRLVYCLPMRTLVEQTQREIRKWLLRLARQHTKPRDGSDLRWLALHSPVILMGGEEADRQWDICPEKPAILVGTQDMLLSRALNRGYGMSRYRWPMHFGLLNNDSLWVFDEVQLMGNGLATGIQLDAFRSALWPIAKRCVTWWMSATTSAAVFETTDRVELAVPPPQFFGLTAEERRNERLASRLEAAKTLELLAKPPKATDVLRLHQAGRLTLIVVNTVRSALRWHADIKVQLDKLRGAKRKAATPNAEIILLHSRFRRVDRDERMKRLQQFLGLTRETGAAPEKHPGLVAVATQVVEAGVDLSAAVLWSEIAPWASLVQRLGRLNRDGKQQNAIGRFWMPKPEDEENGKDSPNAGRNGPYDKTTLKQADNLINAVVTNLNRGENYRTALDAVLETEASQKALKLAAPVVIRADDVHGLFSTEPDLAGGFTNVGPFVRSADLSSDVTLYWRDLKGVRPEVTEEVGAEEIVPVPSYLLSHFLAERKRPAFLWDEDAERWNSLSAKEVVPGMTLLLPADAGGYSDERGWTGNSQDKPTVLAVPHSRRSSLFTDRESAVGWQLLAEHTAAVAAATGLLAEALGFPAVWRREFATAARWHDAGKAHPRWQKALPPAPAGRTGPWGKFDGEFASPPRFRHEAFSLLAAWRQRLANAPEPTALALYLVASHHGKIRTVLRSVKREDNLFGWRADDEPLLVQGEPPCAVDLSVRCFAGDGQVDWASKSFKPGRPSWGSIIDELVGPAWSDDAVPHVALLASEPRALGPFQLAFLEAVFRAADARASVGDFLSAQP